MPHTTAITWDDLESAHDWVSGAPPFTNSAFFSRQTGQVFCASVAYDSPHELPDDIDDAGLYLAMPHKNDLDLGRDLVMDFTDQALPDDHDTVLHYFSKRGAYGRFKDLLQRRGRLDDWFEFERQATEAALRAWAEENDLAVTGGPRHAGPG